MYYISKTFNIYYIITLCTNTWYDHYPPNGTPPPQQKIQNSQNYFNFRVGN